jgi:beta-aspartyl-peptidase (threonine type)
MDGKNKACGAVAGVTTIKNPISLARRVMTNTRHVLLSGPGAEAFAKSFPEIKKVENKYFDTERSRKAWERTQRLRKKTGGLNHNNQTPIAAGDTASYIGTVGCVALDYDGNLAAATSTGGLTNKKFGRIGDSPIIGAGTFADNKTCAVSCTGIGEQFIRNAVAYNVSARLRFLNQPIEKSVQAVLNEDLKKGDGGIIAVDRDGNISMEYTTSGMARAAADSAGRFEVIWVEHKKQTSKQKN